jgi:hypothetical protein
MDKTLVKNHSHNFIDLTGVRLGKLLVLGLSKKSTNGEIKFNCLCDCGNTTNVYSANIRRGLTKSCGCERNKLTSERMKENNPSERKYKIDERFFSTIDTEEKAQRIMYG